MSPEGRMPEATDRRLREETDDAHPLAAPAEQRVGLVDATRKGRKKGRGIVSPCPHFPMPL